MDLRDFRLMHSELVEHYQFIEFHLEGIYAALCGDGFCEGLSQVEAHSISRLMKAIRKLEEDRGAPVLTESQWQELAQVNARRNFWCHECYVNLSFDVKTGGLRNISDLRQLVEDRNRASGLRDLLYEKKMGML